MNVPDHAAEIISRYFDNGHAPENDAALTELLRHHPDAAASFVSTARLHALLESRMPRRRTPPVFKWITAGTAAALTAAAAFAFIPRDLTPVGGNTPAGKTWTSLADTTIPRAEISPGAGRMHDFYHHTDPESFVPLPDLKLSRWDMQPRNGEDHLEIKVTATWPGDLRRKRNQAQRCSVDADGGIHPVTGHEISLGSLSLASPAWPESRISNNPNPPRSTCYETARVYFDHQGNTLQPVEKSPPLVIQNERSTSTLEVAFYAEPSARILGFCVLDAHSEAWLNQSMFHESTFSSTPGLRVISSEVILASAAPVEIVVELGLPRPEQELTLLPAPDSSAKNASFEARILGSIAGVWTRGSSGSSLGTLNGSAERSLRRSIGPSIDGRQYPDESSSCTFAIALPPGQEVEIEARTAGSIVSTAFSTAQSADALFGMWSFATPLSSVQSLIIRPLQRHRIFFKVPLPRDPWNGLNDGVTDALSLRMPSVRPASDEARKAVSALLGIDEAKTYHGYPAQFEWVFSGGPELQKPTIRQILQEIEKLTGRPIKMDRAYRTLRDR